MDERGKRILRALDEVSARHRTVPAPSRDQRATLTRAAALELTPDEVATLDRASA